ncbi:MAG: GNAT family N-acetyltransferase [Flavobacterium sp. BFFFF2]|nr:MAG: GNAT family N-acetyltransferase [Flavobacterium sp. BFFFF2]
MNLKTNRLLLREITIDDIPSIHALNSLAEIDQYNTAGIPADIKETEQLIIPIIHDQLVQPRPRYVWYLTDADNEFVGLVGVVMGKQKYESSEIWYKIHPTHWTKGFATEVVQTILHFCFTELKLHRITAGCATENMASIRVLEKCGFTREGRCRKILPIRGQWVDNFEYAILEEDYFKVKL